MAAERLEDITSWLVDGARSASGPDAVLGELCERLAAAGLPLSRAGVFVTTLHPDIFGRAFIWRLGEKVAINEGSFDATDSDEFRKSPLGPVLRTGTPVRHRLTGNDTHDDAPLLDSMRADGFTDYVAFPLAFTDGSMHAASWTTKQASGFSDADVAAL